METPTTKKATHLSPLSRGAQLLYKKLIKPKSDDPDQKRREFITNILLLASLVLSFVALVIVIYFVIQLGDGAAGRGLSASMAVGVFAFFGILLAVSRMGYARVSSYIFVGILWLEALFTLYSWGVELSTGLLILTLVIVMAGILVSTRFAFIVTGITTIVVILLAYWQINDITQPKLYWRTEALGFQDSIVYVLIFAIIAVIAWLGNREIEKSLKRARQSEAQLRDQRDHLEDIVEERTKELKQAQLEKMTQLYRFAEFGRHASGVFHELVNPLTAVSLNIQQVKDSKQPQMDDAKRSLEKAFTATKKMERFIDAVKRQVQSQDMATTYSLIDEINQAVTIVEHKAKKLDVTITVQGDELITSYGNPHTFGQVITNLVANALDAYDHQSTTLMRTVTINLQQKDTDAVITVEDMGGGIAPDHIKRIFNPFFSTKEPGAGMGVGLSISKEIIEKDLRGTIEVQSRPKAGSTFTVRFPLTTESQSNEETTHQHQ